MLRRLGPLTVIIILAAGCSSSNDDAGDNEAKGFFGSPTTSSVENAPEEASIEDYARVVAERHADWDDQVETTESNCLDPLMVTACSLGHMTLGMQAETIRLSLSALHKTDAPGYVGLPPEEIADLVTETEDAAAEVNAASGPVVDCTDPMATDCFEQLLDMEMAVSELSGKLDAWEVYS